MLWAGAGMLSLAVMAFTSFGVLSEMIRQADLPSCHLMHKPTNAQRLIGPIEDIAQHPN